MSIKLFLALALASIVLWSSCTPSAGTTASSENQQEVDLFSGTWRFSLLLHDTELPFNAELDFRNGESNFVIINGAERIELTDVSLIGDSLFAFFPVFDTEIRARIDDSRLITGKWYDHGRGDYSIDLIGEADKDFQFTSQKSSLDIPLRSKISFGFNDESPWDAILEITNTQGRIHGTFLTETGDYRFLTGNIINDKLLIGTFDGGHAFYFDAEIKGDSLVNGRFLSGIHYETDWYGYENPTFQLNAPDILTYLNPGYSYLDFYLPNQDGDSLSWADLKLEGKVVIVDIIGSWCPNCYDASIALKDLTREYQKEDLEILTIAFEKTENLDQARNRVFKMQDAVGLEKGFLFGGRANKTSSSNIFPMLNHIMSYPTIIFIDRNRTIRQIYTGFYGPGTGKHYSEFMANTEELIENMVRQPNI